MKRALVSRSTYLKQLVMISWLFKRCSGTGSTKIILKPRVGLFQDNMHTTLGKLNRRTRMQCSRQCLKLFPGS